MFLSFRAFRGFRILVLALIALPAWCGTELSPGGVWKTIDDKTRQPRGTIRIYQEDGAWFGRIETSLNPAEQNALCDKCTGDRKDRPVIGMVIMRGLVRHGSDYSGGEILDPDTGEVYRCRFTLSEDGGKLLVRGYLGFSLLGRTQTWIRQND